MTDCVGQHGDDRPEADVGYLCAKCFGRLRSALLEVPAIAGWLAVNITASGAELTEKIGGTREDPIPLRPDVLDLIGPDSRHWVASTRPEFVLWDDTTPLAGFDSWPSAAAALREAMTAGGVDLAVVTLLVTQPAHDRETKADDCTDGCPRCRLLEALDYDELEAARTRWQIRPTDRGGCDQRGVDALRAVLFSWVTVVTEANPGFDWPDYATDLTSLAGWLAGHLSWIAGQPWVDELIGEIRKAGSDAHRLAPWREEVMRSGDPCPSCQVRAVVLHVARSTMVCEKHIGGCGKSWSSPYLKQATA